MRVSSRATARTHLPPHTHDVPSIDKVAQEEVVGVWRVAAYSKQLQQVPKLSNNKINIIINNKTNLIKNQFQ